MPRLLAPILFFSIALISLLMLSACTDVKPANETEEPLRTPAQGIPTTEETTLKDVEKESQTVPRESIPICGECQYVTGSTCTGYACCEDLMCDDGVSYTSDTCTNPKTLQARCEHRTFCQKGVKDWETVEGECSKFKPFYCDPATKELAINCSICGCKEGQRCSNDDTCVDNMLCAGNFCTPYQECVNNRCIMKKTPYRLGLVYVYTNEDNYNPNWKAEMSVVKSKVESGIKELTDNKVDVSIEILDEVKTDEFCWNPAIVGFQYRTPDFAFESGEVVPGQLHYGRMPGSAFVNTGTQVEGELTANYCNNCEVDKTGSGFAISISCENALSYDNIWKTDKLEQLKTQISSELGTDLNTYDGIFIVFGKLGQVLPEQSLDNLKYRCDGLTGIISGYSNLIMAENSIVSGGTVRCSELNPDNRNFYDKPGWHTMVHEILHRFEAVDIYETGTLFGIRSEREKALEIDPRADESVMGNNNKACIDEGGYERDGNICTIQDLERLYLDKYNRQKIGLE